MLCSIAVGFVPPNPPTFVLVTILFSNKKLLYIWVYHVCMDEYHFKTIIWSSWKWYSSSSLISPYLSFSLVYFLLYHQPHLIHLPFVSGYQVGFYTYRPIGHIFDWSDLNFINHLDDPIFDCNKEMLLRRQSSLFAHILCMMSLVVRHTEISIPLRVAAEEWWDTIYM